MTKFHDARIETRVEKTVRDKFAELARVNHMTPSELNRMMIIQFVQGRIHLQAVGSVESCG